MIQHIKRHLDNYHTMVIVDNYYKIYNRQELIITNELLEEVQNYGNNLDNLVRDLVIYND